MKIGINLVGVSYNDGSTGRYRNYEDAIDSFYDKIINPLKLVGHDIKFYIFTYDNVKKNEIINAYNPIIKSEFIHPVYNTMGGGDVLPNGMKTISVTYINSLQQLINEDLDFVISTRFDIAFHLNPFEEFEFEFDKFNFLFREPEFTNLPIVSDTFYAFPHHMTQNLIDAIIEMESNPTQGVNIAMHNMYLPMVNQVGEDKVKWVCNDYYSSEGNKIYKLTRHG
jgi:hypothetical protein